MLGTATASQPSTLDDLKQRYPEDRLLVLPLNITDSHRVANAFTEVTRMFGRIDVVFNNVGVGDSAELEAMEEEKARATFETNFWGALNVTKESLKCFRETNPPRAGGRLLQMASLAGLVGLPALSFYSASKFVLVGVSEVLTAELDPAWNIKVTIIEPGWIRSNWISKTTWSPEHPAYRNSNLPMVQIHGSGWDKLATWKDMKRCAEAFHRIASVPTPPLHFLVGKDAIGGARKKITTLSMDINTYETWSEGLDE
ncbi:hypothetical protein V8D89_007440 [Ganoderma adspersum]